MRAARLDAHDKAGDGRVVYSLHGSSFGFTVALAVPQPLSCVNKAEIGNIIKGALGLIQAFDDLKTMGYNPQII